MILEIFTLLIAFQFKHLIADYYLQFPYMYENKGNKNKWAGALFDHCLVHAMLTLLILGVYFAEDKYIPIILIAIVFDFVTHFITDRWKATRRRKPNEKKFWTDLGIDQMVHHIVGIIIVFAIVIWK